MAPATGPLPASAAITHFVVRVPRPRGPWRETLEAALTVDGRAPLRWAVTAVEGETLVIEGARWA